MNATSLFRRLSSSAVVWILAAGLCVSNILLLRQNQELRSRLEAMQPVQPHFGYQVPPLRGLDKDGEEIVPFPPGTARVLLLFFSPTCRFCQKQFTFWSELVHLDAKTPLLGIVPNTFQPKVVEDFLKDYDGTALRVLFADGPTLESYRLSATPTTLLVSRAGIVEEGWIGLLTEEGRAKVRKIATGQVEAP